MDEISFLCLSTKPSSVPSHNEALTGHVKCNPHSPVAALLNLPYYSEANGFQFPPPTFNPVLILSGQWFNDSWSLDPPTLRVTAWRILHHCSEWVSNVVHWTNRWMEKVFLLHCLNRQMKFPILATYSTPLSPPLKREWAITFSGESISVGYMGKPTCCGLQVPFLILENLLLNGLSPQFSIN